MVASCMRRFQNLWTTILAVALIYSASQLVSPQRAAAGPPTYCYCDTSLLDPGAICETGQRCGAPSSNNPCGPLPNGSALCGTYQNPKVCDGICMASDAECSGTFPICDYGVFCDSNGQWTCAPGSPIVIDINGNGFALTDA